MTRPCECGLAQRRPERLFGFESAWVDGAPSSDTGSLAPGDRGLPSTAKLAALGKLGNWEIQGAPRGLADGNNGDKDKRA
jgi:hypothetical protein